MSWDFQAVILARHGETEWNRERRRQGQLDSPLTDRGTAQVSALGDALMGLGPDAVLCSPLGRAAATADMLAVRLGLRTLIIDELAEIHHGLMAGLSDAEIEQEFPGELDRRESDKWHWRFPCGESYADAEARAAEALRRAASGGARRPLIVSHEMIGRVLLMQLLDLDVQTALAQRHPNDVLYVIDPATRSCSETRAQVRERLRPA